MFLRTTEMFSDEHFDGAFLLVSASGTFLNLTRQYFSLFDTQILAMIVL